MTVFLVSLIDSCSLVLFCCINFWKWITCSHQIEDDRADADEKRNSDENLENVGRVEVLNFEPPQLVQPNEVKVSCMEVMEKLEPMRTPLGKK